jgi:flagellar capping protein FliD
MLIRYEEIAKKILLVRGKKVMLDRDLAKLYGVTTGNLNKAVKRNKERFPNDFMFQLTKQEFENLIFHFGRSSWGGVRKIPIVFTEHGILMLSSVLKSKRAATVNIQIMRIFIRMRAILFNYKNLKEKIENVEKKYDSQFRVIFEAIKQLMAEEEKPKRNIGFK